MATLIENSAIRDVMSRSVALLKAWFRQPSQVASICPSSPILTQTVAERECLHQATSVVDLGPGTGASTTALLANMRRDAKLLAIEKTSAFLPHLRRLHDHRLIVEQADAAQLSELLREHKMKPPDVIISGIPFSSIDPEIAGSVVRTIHSELRPGGTFIAYQLRSDIQQHCQPLFGAPAVEWVWCNLPPLRVYCWQKD